MRDPPDQATADDAENAPDFDAFEPPEDLLAGDRTRDDFFSVALQLREPTQVAAIAERAGRGVDAAREYMRWFETMGLVQRASDDPEQYETNRSYLYWRRVDRIRRDYRDAEIVERLQDVLDDIDDLAGQYDASDPRDLDIVTTARERGVDVEDVWEDTSRWKTLLARRTLLEDALDREQDRYLDSSRSDDGRDRSHRRPA